MTTTTTTGVFKYADPATIVKSDVPFVKPWAKVDGDVTSFSRTERQKSVHDIRSQTTDASGASSAPFGVDVSGFALYRQSAQEKEFTDDAAVRNGYYAEVEKLLRDKLSTPEEPVKKVVIFDHTIRRRNPQAPRQPVQQVHVDQTPAAAEARVRRHVPDEADELLKGRYQIINVWRPIGHPAADHPLALVDWRTTKPDDLVKVDLLYPDRPAQNGQVDDGDDRGKEVLPDPAKERSTEGYSVKGETYTVVPNDSHQFYYVKNMTPDEVVFIKCFDSRSAAHANGRQGVAAWTPHTAFTDPATPKDAPGRQSIEVRCLVFY